MLKKIVLFIVLLHSALMAEFKEVNVAELEDMMKKNVQIIDIRTPAEWKETGVINGSHKIMFFDERGGYNIDKWMAEFSKYVKDQNQPLKSKLNFGGTEGELCCAGGEIAFLKQMCTESVNYGKQVGWFTTLVSKSENIAPLKKILTQLNAKDVKVIKMAQGQKISRILAWQF